MDDYDSPEDDFWQEADGTWTVHLEPWHCAPITGIPTEGLAVAIVKAMHEAMEHYAGNALTED